MKKTYYLIGNAHLDPVWQWQAPEGLSLVKSTFRSALDRMKEYPDYKFTSACASYYKWIKLSEPGMFEEIKERVKEGRWGVTGGMWVQPDCNIPSGEAFCRHLLYSQKFFKENFGSIAKTGYNVDSFGHNGMLPQLLKKSGIDNYVYMRPNREAEKPSLPSENLHIWQSPDGSRVKAFRILDGYGDDLREERIDRYREKSQSQMLFYGIGNHGGGPSKEHLNSAENLVKNDDFKYAVPDEYFNEVDEDMPTVTEDLQHHASGCYSANSAIKSANRRAECELVSAEKFDVLSSLLTSSETHKNSISSAWERVMFNQFHDILAGCSIKEAYTDALNAFGYARETALEIGTFAQQKISWRIKTTDFLNACEYEMRDRMWYREGEGAPIVVFNPHSFPVNSYASFGTQRVSRVVDCDGNDVPFQLVRASYTDGGTYLKCLFKADIPAYGYKVFYLYRKEEYFAETAFDTDVSACKNYIENRFLRAEIDEESGAVIKLTDKRSGKNFAGEKLGRAIICNDIKNDTWAHAVTEFNDEIGSFGGGKCEVIENGPIRATIKSTVKYNNSVFIRYYSLYSESDSLFVKCRLDFDEEYKLMKLCFETALQEPSVTYSMPYGFIEKDANSQEEPSHAWTDIHDRNGVGLGIINDGKYSFCACGNDLRMMTARGCAYLDHFGQKYRDGEMQFLDKGEQEFCYEIVPHTKNINSYLFKRSELLNTPLSVQQETHHDGTLPEVFSALNIDKDNIVVTAVKPAEDGDGIILRIVECAGERTKAKISFNALNTEFEPDFAPQEIKTVRIKADGKIKEELIIE